MRFLLPILLFLSPVAQATTTPVSHVPTSAFEYSFNKWFGGIAAKYLLGTVLRESHTTAVGTYSFADQGGAVGTFATGITLPNKAIIRRVFFDVITAPTSGGSATVAFKAVSTGDLKAALAIASWTGRVAGIQDGTTGNMIKLAAEKTIYAEVATAALTAGKIKVFVDYALSE